MNWKSKKESRQTDHSVAGIYKNTEKGGGDLLLLDLKP